VPVNVLIVGGGSIGERHLRCFQQIGCDVALCESNEARRHELADRYQRTRTFAAIEEAAREHWFGIVIATPAHLHAEHAALLAGATSALLIEKPFCTRLSDVEWLRLATAGKVVQIGYVLRVHPATQRVRELLAAGDIGPLHEVTVTAGQHFPSLRPAYREIYYARRETGGGAVQDAATHLFDIIQYLAGPLDWVFCDYAHQELADVEVEDTVHVVGRAGSERVLVSLALNQFMVPNETHVQLNGARGSLAIRFHEHRAGMFLLGDPAWTWTEPLVAERDDLFRAQAESFLAAAVGQQPPICTLEDGVRALLVNLAALRSGEHHTVEMVDPTAATLGGRGFPS
jgi:predicted dehydrogenase